MRPSKVVFRDWGISWSESRRGIRTWGHITLVTSTNIERLAKVTCYLDLPSGIKFVGEQTQVNVNSGGEVDLEFENQLLEIDHSLSQTWVIVKVEIADGTKASLKRNLSIGRTG